MNERAEIIEEADQLPATMIDAADASLAVGLSRAEIDTQISTARRYPRDLTSVQKRLLSYVTLDEETAEECMYALPRGGKPITGPSVRFAEALKASFGNCRAAARVVHVDRVEKVVIAEGIFHDLETNSASKAEIRRRICDRRGRIYTDDMIIVTGNAACSIALRNAILAGVPKPVWRRAYETVQRTITGDVKTLSVTRDKAVKALAAFGVTPEQIFTALDVAGMDDMTVEHIPILRGMFSALKNGESTVEEMFTTTVKQTSHTKIENPLSDDEPESVAQAPSPDTAASESSDAGQARTSRDVPAQAISGDEQMARAQAMADAREQERTQIAGATAGVASGGEARAADVSRPEQRSGPPSVKSESEVMPPGNVHSEHRRYDTGGEARSPAGQKAPEQSEPVTRTGGPPSVLQQYWNAINVDEAIGPRDVAKLSNKFFDSHTVDDAERAQCLRLRTIRDNVLAGFFPRAEGEEKAREIMGS